MALVGSVNAKLRNIAATCQPAFANLQFGKLLARRSDCVKGAARCAVVNDAPGSRRQPYHLLEPIYRDLFKLCRRRARLPDHTVDVEGGAEQFAQDSRAAAR